MRPHRQRPTRLPRPWDSPGKNTGVGCHFLLQCMKVKSESEVAQSCPTPSDPMDCRPLRTWDFPGEYWNQYFAFICSFSSSMFFDKPTIALGDMKHSLWRDLCFKSESANEVPQSCPTLCDPMVCSLPGSSVHGIFQARVLEWVTISFSRGSSWCREQALSHLSHQGSPLFFI